MKVILTTPHWRLNGVNIFIETLARGLFQRGIDARILVTRAKNGLGNDIPVPGDIPVDHLNVQPFASLTEIRKKLIQYLEAERPCVYVPNHDFGASSICYQLSRDIRIVGIVHSDDPDHYEHVYRLGKSWDSIVAVSRVIAARIISERPDLRRKVQYIPYGVERSLEGSRNCEAGQRLRLIYLGRLTQYQKRTNDLFHIAQALWKQKVPFKLTVAGDGWNRRDLEKRFHKYLPPEKFEFLGNVSHRHGLSLLRKQDVFLMTSSFEGLPISLIEGMSQGCVPVVSDIKSGIPELIKPGYNGFIVPTGKIAEYVRVLELLGSDPELTELMSVRAHRTIADLSLQPELMTDRYLSVFTDESANSCDSVRHSSSNDFAPPLLPPSWPQRLPELSRAVLSAGRFFVIWRRQRLSRDQAKEMHEGVMQS